MPYLLQKIFSAKMLPERSKGGYGGYGVLFEFSDGWVEACFHMTKEEAERQTRRIGESVPVPTYAGRLKPGMSR
jgi:hypothetical protein